MRFCVKSYSLSHEELPFSLLCEWGGLHANFEQNKKKSIVNENLEKTPNQVLIQLSYLGSSLCYWR